MATYTRYAIRINCPPDYYGGKRIWYCQGLPKDPEDFGFAIMYGSLALAEKAVKKMRGTLSNYAEIVEVTCKVEEV